MSASFARAADVTASTKRNPPAAAGKVGAAVTHLSSLRILALMPVSKEIIERYKLSSPRKSFVTFTEGAPDVAEGDVLVVAGVEYKVIGAAVWRGFLELVVEKVVGA